MIFPALAETKSPLWRPIEYSLLSPFRQAPLLSLLSSENVVELFDDHVETVSIDDKPNLVAIQVYNPKLASTIFWQINGVPKAATLHSFVARYFCS